MIRKGTLLIIGCFICLMLLFSAGSAYALATSFSEAYIDWSNISFSGIEIEWWWEDSESWAGAWDDVLEVDDYGDTSALAEVPNAVGEAWVSDDEVGEEVWAQADGISTIEAEAWAGAVHYGAFQAMMDGILTISADYFLSQDLSTEYQNEFSAGYAYAELGLYNCDSWDQDYDYDELENELWDGDTWGDSASDTFMASLWFDEGDEGGFWAYVDNGAYAFSEYCEEEEEPIIPEPATMVLFSIGFLGFGFLKGKRRGTT